MTERRSARPPAQPSGGQGATSRADLARAGFEDTAAALRLLGDAVLADVDGPALVAALAATPDPDRGLLAAVRLLAAAETGGQGLGDDLRRVLPGGGPTPGPARPGDQRGPRGPGGAPSAEDRLGTGTRLVAVLGTSVALGEHLIAHPDAWRELVPGAHADQDPREVLLRAVGADPGAVVPVADPTLGRDGARDALRRAYRRRLLGIVADDLVTPAPEARLEDVTERLSDLADAALEAGLAMARALVPGHRDVALAVIALGKCGARELNYLSDVDVVHVVAPAENPDGPDVDEPRVVEVGTRLAQALALACSATTAEGSLWEVDTALRPEGKNGPLVRTLDSHVAHHRRWAATWELQAQMKARPAAGDPSLGAAYVEALAPLVWRAAERPGMVADTRAMRRRVEEQLPSADSPHQLKLGPGGLRDVEFSVQLLQLVHGRAAPALRVRATLEALAALSAHGFVGRQDAARLDADYRFLRVLEHRLQLHRMRRAQLLPRDEDGLRWLARAAGVPGGAEALSQRLGDVRRRVRRLHEQLFYRPLLEAVAALSTEELRLTPEEARERLQSLGYRDAAGALRHITALTTGVSRRAAIQRQLLPVLLGWFADGSDPDGGLLAFRRISETLGSTAWYLAMLRDEGTAAARMARATSTSSLVAGGLVADAQAARWLGDDAALVPRGEDDVGHLLAGALGRAGGAAEAARALRTVRTRELLRTALADVLGLVSAAQVRESLSGVATGAIRAALGEAGRRVARERGASPTAIAVIGMGRLGGQEMGYGSDADVVVVHRPLPGADAEAAQEHAVAVTSAMRGILATPGPGLPLELDLALRPEGRNGPLARSLDSCAAYYARWSSTWESQALLRARVVAGDAGVGAAFLDLVDPLRYPVGGLPADAVVAVRRMKARVESERLPRGVDPHRHLKLGPGYLADVEWTAQLLQLRHAGRVRSLRTASTPGALWAACAAGLLSEVDARVLVAAWDSAARTRDAVVLVRGRIDDVLPTDPEQASQVAHLLGLDPETAEELTGHVRQVGRGARTVVERVFYG